MVANALKLLPCTDIRHNFVMILGIEFYNLPVSEPESEPGSRTGQYQNWNWNRKSWNRESLVGLTTQRMDG